MYYFRLKFFQISLMDYKYPGFVFFLSFLGYVPINSNGQSFLLPDFKTVLYENDSTLYETEKADANLCFNWKIFVY